MENENKRIPVLTIVAASFTTANIVAYAIFIAAFFYGFGNFPDFALTVAMFGLPTLSIVGFILSIKCRHDNIKPFWIPNLIISIVFLISCFPASCASTIQSIHIANQKDYDRRTQEALEEAQERATIEFIKEDMAYRGTNYHKKEVVEYFIAMDFTLLSHEPAVVTYLSNPFIQVDRSFEYGYGVTFFSDYSGIVIDSYVRHHQYIGGTVSAGAKKYYSCNQEEAIHLYELMNDYESSSSYQQ